ncbi:MAG: AMP-binding protein, partial [Pseudomonadales bacterium]|nr:AMP-binding protein [Pseudomonadales bacterium]
MSNETVVPSLDIETRRSGELILSHPASLGPLPRSTAHLLIERAREWPDRTLIAEKVDGSWHTLTYREAVEGCRRVAQWLLEHGASRERPLAILSGASINHFLMAWGAVFARVPYVPVSLSYSTVPGAFPKFDAVIGTVKPSFVFAERLSDHRDAISASDYDFGDVSFITCDDGGENRRVDWQELVATKPTGEVDASIDAIDHDTVTRYMFTSGSTGMPKGVIVTHGMSCHMLAASAAVRDTPDTSVETRVLDWMPWSHVGAGVMRLAMMINAGGSIYLDTGKPVPAEFAKTIDNLREVKPTGFAGAPLGWSMLADALEADDDLARTFFENVRSMQFGSAAMPDSLAARIQGLAEKYAGHRFPFGTSLASTEVHGAISKYWPSEQTDTIGLPMPGAELKLVPLGDKYEFRVKARGVTPGYLGEPEKTNDAV